MRQRGRDDGSLGGARPRPRSGTQVGLRSLDDGTPATRLSCRRPDLMTAPIRGTAGRSRKDVGESHMPDEYANLMQSTSQPPYAVIVVVVAILAVAGVASVAIFHYDDAADALAVIGTVTAVISSLVAAFLGVRSGSLAQQKANEGAAIQALAASRGRSPCLAGGSDASAQRRRRRAHLTGPRPRRECGHLPRSDSAGLPHRRSHERTRSHVDYIDNAAAGTSSNAAEPAAPPHRVPRHGDARMRAFYSVKQASEFAAAPGAAAECYDADGRLVEFDDASMPHASRCRRPGRPSRAHRARSARRGR